MVDVGVLEDDFYGKTSEIISFAEPGKCWMFTTFLVARAGDEGHPRPGGSSPACCIDT